MYINGIMLNLEFVLLVLYKLNRGTLFTQQQVHRQDLISILWKEDIIDLVYIQDNMDNGFYQVTNFSTNRWYHVAFTGVYGRQNIYIDGKLTKSSSYPSFRNWTHTTSQQVGLV